jgi:transcriptional regulator with XRE-family HTH domain
MSIEITITTKAHKKLIAALHDARKKSGLRQTQVAKKLGRSQTWIARVEKGKRRVDVVEFVALAKLFHVDPHKLLGRVMVDSD